MSGAEKQDQFLDGGSWRRTAVRVLFSPRFVPTHRTGRDRQEEDKLIRWNKRRFAIQIYILESVLGGPRGEDDEELIY